MPGLQNSKSTLDFLGGVGTAGRGDEVPLNNTAKALIKLAEFLILEATNNLQRKGHIASGDTASSMKAVNLQTTGTKFSLDIEIISTYKFIDQGVKGTAGGNGKYSFKNNFASKKMATAILLWLRRRGAGGKTKYKAKSANERKNKRINKTITSADNLKRLAYATSVSIKKKGIKPTRFFSDAIKETEKRQRQVYGQAFKLDIIESMKSLK